MNPTITILPFADFVEENEPLLGRAIAIEVAHYLTGVPEASVVFPTTSGKEVMRSTNVEYILQGTVLTKLSKITLTFQLLEGKGFEIVYSNKIVEEFDQLSSLPKRIATQLIQFLEFEFSNTGVAGFIDGKTYEYYLKGLHFWNLWSKDHVIKAIAYFEKALKNDPEFSLCWARLSNSFTMLAAIQQGGKVETNYKKAKESALKAISLDDTLIEAHNSLALVKLLNDLDILGAYHSLQKAINLNHRSPETRYFYSYYLLIIKKYKEAINYLKYALRYDPDNIQINSTYGFALSLSGDFDKAEEQLLKTLELDPSSDASYDALFWSYFLAGNTHLAMKILVEHENSILHTPATQIVFYKKICQTDRVNYWLNKLENDNKSESYNRNASIAYWALGDAEKALHHLELLYNEKSGFVMVLTHPAWKSLRENPKFYKYKKRLKLLRPPVLSKQEANKVPEQIVILSKTTESITIQADKLICIEAQNIYSKVVWETDDHQLEEKFLRVSLNQILEQTLNPNLFRCHRSFLVNKLRKYRLIGNRKSMKIVPIEFDFEIPVSRKLSSEIHDQLELF